MPAVVQSDEDGDKQDRCILYLQVAISKNADDSNVIQVQSTVADSLRVSCVR